MLYTGCLYNHSYTYISFFLSYTICDIQCVNIIIYLLIFPSLSFLLCYIQGVYLFIYILIFPSLYPWYYAKYRVSSLVRSLPKYNHEPFVFPVINLKSIFLFNFLDNFFKVGILCPQNKLISIVKSCE